MGMEPWPEPESAGGFSHQAARAQLMGQEEAEPPPRPEEPAPAQSAFRPAIAQARATAADARMNSDAPSEDEALDPKSAEVLRQWQAALAPMLVGNRCEYDKQQRSGRPANP